jgi:hypothetical protein
MGLSILGRRWSRPGATLAAKETKLVSPQSQSPAKPMANGQERSGNGQWRDRETEIFLATLRNGKAINPVKLLQNPTAVHYTPAGALQLRKIKFSTCRFSRDVTFLSIRRSF